MHVDARSHVGSSAISRIIAYSGVDVWRGGGGVDPRLAAPVCASPLWTDIRLSRKASYPCFYAEVSCGDAQPPAIIANNTKSPTDTSL